MPKKTALFILTILMLVLLVGCGEISLSSTEVNQVEIPNGPDDLAKLGKALNDKSDIKVAITAPEASYILDSLASIGEVTTEDFSLELELIGSGDWTKLADLATIRGLTTLTLTGENDMTSLDPLTALPDLADLRIYNGVVSDLSPLQDMPALESLHLELEEYDFATLMNLDVQNIEIPMQDTIWVAMDLLTKNPSVQTINQSSPETFTSKEYLEDDLEKTYYYNQYADVVFLNQIMQDMKVGKYTKAAGGTKAPLTGSVMIAAPAGLIQESPYREQAMLKTACGYNEEDDVIVYFPYIEGYDDTADDPTLVRFAGTAALKENFIVSVSEDDCETIVFYYAYTDTVAEGESGETVELSHPVVQIVNLRDQIVYDPVPLATVDLSLSAEELRQAHLGSLGKYLMGLEIVE